MLRSLANRLRGRRKVWDASVSLAGALNLLHRLSPDIRVNLSYDGRHHGVGKQCEWTGETPARVAAFLEFQFGENSQSSNRRQLYVGRRSVKTYIDLKDFSQKATIIYKA